jgi:hypothetical protein
LVGTAMDLEGFHIWDSVGFSQSARLQFTHHCCSIESRRDLARDAKLEADRRPRGE